MTRSDIVRELMKHVSDDDIVIASTGYIAREVFRYDRPLNFYMMGSMGNALAIGLGLSMHVKQRVIVINGDGSVLMSLGSLLTARKYGKSNLLHFILSNGCHESTGGQELSWGFGDIRFCCTDSSVHTQVYTIEKDKSMPPRITLKPSQITERFKNAVQSLRGK